MLLSELEVGDQFVVSAVKLEHEVGRRLADMGFVEGARGVVLRREIANGPIDVRIIGYEVLLRHSEAQGIEIEKFGDRYRGVFHQPSGRDPTGRHPNTEAMRRSRLFWSNFLKTHRHISAAHRAWHMRHGFPGMPEKGVPGTILPGEEEERPESKPLRKIRIGLAGNPNCGKTTLFNALTGSHVQVGNYPGVTVERTEGTVNREDADGNPAAFTFTDLPGIYSLTAYSEDEVVSRDFLINEKPDFIIDVLDMTNLARNLNLTTQLAELKIPVICALNMVEEAASKGITVDETVLAKDFHIPFFKINAKNRKGVDKLFDCMLNYAEFLPKIDEPRHPFVDYGDEVEQYLEKITPEIEKAASGGAASALPVPARWLAVKLLEKDKHAKAMLENHPNLEKINFAAADAITWIEGHYGKSSEIVMSEQRYGYIAGAVREAEKVVKRENQTLSQKIDNVVMHPVLALPLFLVVLFVIFELTFTIGAYPQAWLQMFFTWLANLCVHYMPDNILRSLLVDGVIAGVGGVLSFVPLIVILFFFLSILEDLGYMSRAAFATDKLLHAVGLHGQSIFPMMLGFGCSVPAIMASRTMKN
jgi:ferrous iron transport protein B